MKEETEEILGNAYDIIQELQETIAKLTKGKAAQLGVINRSNFVLDQINDALYENL